IAEVEELPGHVDDHDHDVLTVPGDLLAGDDIHHVGDGREGKGEHRGTDEQVDGVGQEAGYRPRVLALRGHRPGGHGGAHFIASLAGASLGPAGGAPGSTALASGGVSSPGGCGATLSVVDRAGAWVPASPSSMARGATGAGCFRRSTRCTRRSMNWSSPTAWLRAAS